MHEKKRNKVQRGRGHSVFISRVYPHVCTWIYIAVIVVDAVKYEIDTYRGYSFVKVTNVKVWKLVCLGKCCQWVKVDRMLQFMNEQKKNVLSMPRLRTF